MVEKIEQFFIDALGLAGSCEGLFEVLLGKNCRHRGERFCFSEDSGEELADSFGGNLSLLGEIGKHLVDFVVRHGNI